MENLQNSIRVPSVSMFVEGRRRGPFNADLDLIQEYSIARLIPIDEHMFVYTEMARLDIVEALCSATMGSGSHMFPTGCGTLVPTAHNPYLVNENYALQVVAQRPESEEEREIFYHATQEAIRRHREL